jgi:hypothetical protein
MVVFSCECWSQNTDVQRCRIDERRIAVQEIGSRTVLGNKRRWYSAESGDERIDGIAVREVEAKHGPRGKTDGASSQQGAVNGSTGSLCESLSQSSINTL